jgi:hypothetical protein
MNHEHQQQLLQNMLSILNRDREMNENIRNIRNERNHRNNRNDRNDSSFSTFFSGLFLSGLQSYLQQDRTPLVNHLERTVQNYITPSNIERMMNVMENIQNVHNVHNVHNIQNIQNVHIEDDDAAYSYSFEAYYNQGNEEKKEEKNNEGNEYNGKIIVPCELDEKEKERYVQYDSCAICFEPFNMNDPCLSIALTECKHAYHLQCINEWFKRKKDCPVCRTSL